VFTRTLCVLQLHPPACTYGLPHLMHMYMVSSIACDSRREQWWTVVDNGGQWWTMVDKGKPLQLY